LTPPKNFIVRLADHLRSGAAGAAGDDAASKTFESRRELLTRLYARLAQLAPAQPGPLVRVIAKPNVEAVERLMLRCETKIVTLQIGPESEYVIASGCGLGRRFTANPAHLQGDDPVLMAADAGASSYGTEYRAVDFLADAVTGTGNPRI
jgi:hypothetical protein